MAFVGTSFVRRGKVGNAKAKETVRYIQHRRGRDNEAVWRPLFSPDGPMTRLEAYQFIDEAPKLDFGHFCGVKNPCTARD